MRLESGEYPLLAGHLRRLGSSAKDLGFACNVAVIRNGLLAHAAENAAAVHRVRLTLTHAGAWEIASAAFSDDSSPKRALVAADVLDAHYYLLRHKTTARSRYDRVLASLTACPDVFDAIFLNTRGEVCEGARSNVFVERAGTLLTPPLASGLLPGVLRQHLLESWRAVEQVLTLADLAGRPFYLGNALRGLVPVTLES